VSREDWACMAIIVIGLILFLVGANIYNAFAGYLGFFLFIGGIIALIALYIYNYFASRKVPRDEETAKTSPFPSQRNDCPVKLLCLTVL